MPSAPNADSPFMDSRLQSALGVRAPGSPSSAGKPGPQAGDLSFPAPPGINSGEPGRPSGPSTPTPSAGVPSATTPGAAPGASGAPAQQAQPGQEGAEGAAPVGGLPTPSTMPMGGASVATSLGTASRGMDGQPTLSAMTPEGMQRYREAVLKTRSDLGPLPRVFRNPGLPEMPVQPGKWNFNPMTGRWSR